MVHLLGLSIVVLSSCEQGAMWALHLNMASYCCIKLKNINVLLHFYTSYLCSCYVFINIDLSYVWLLSFDPKSSLYLWVTVKKGYWCSVWQASISWPWQGGISKLVENTSFTINFFWYGSSLLTKILNISAF